jgi:hypothetical protein
MLLFIQLLICPCAYTNASGLAFTAEVEYVISKASKGRPSTSKDLDSSEIRKLIPTLANIVEKETKYVEDGFQGRTCLAWAYWIGGEHNQATEQLSGSIEQDFAQLDGTGKDSTTWTKVCALKASYIKGTSLLRTGSPAEALETFESAMPIISTSIPLSSNGPELRTWTELFLTQFCMLSSRAIKSKLTSVLETETLAVFREWARFWEKQPGASTLPAGGYASQANVPRRHVWKEYYATLSIILQQNLPYPTTTMATAYGDTSTRLQQRAELQRVEMRYEQLLLKEISFPRAEQASEEVEEWVNLVMQNWKVLCGTSWQEEELGQGGREAVSRGVLDILYKAATQTFHSTSILRHLFTVHLAVAEFDIAFKAFDTYLEIVTRGKARVEKSGEPEQGLDDNETFVKTTGECIRALSRYGSREAAERANEIASFLEEWLNKHYPKDGNTSFTNGNGTDRLIQNGGGDDLKEQETIAPWLLAQAWRSIGISQAQWARLTFEATSRSEIQLDAIKSLRVALSKEYESTHDVESLFALALVLAERREVSTAIDVVKAALLPRVPATSPESTFSQGNFARERSLIPLWHLLALLLSARQEFTTAVRACEGAFEQFKDLTNLFGQNDLHESYRSEHLNQMAARDNEKSTPRTIGIVDEMDDFEKENILEVKMTQLVLIEVTKGPEFAVNASDELLSLYGRLFGEPQKLLAAPRTAQTIMPPQSSAGTLRSIKGSIFGRSKRSVRKPSDPVVLDTLSEKEDPIRPKTSQTSASTATVAPTIHVTKANGTESHHRHSDHHEKLQKRSGSLSRKKSQASHRSPSVTKPKKASSETPSMIHAEGTEVDHFSSESNLTAPHKVSEHLDQWQASTRLSQVGLAISPDHSSIGFSIAEEKNHMTTPKALALSSQNMARTGQTLQSVHLDSKQDNRLPHVANPVTRFPRDQERRRRLSILVRVWLLIAGFYRRAELYGDANGAVDEAEKLVIDLATDITKDTSGTVSIDIAGWGNKKSIEEMWADIYSEVLTLLTAYSCIY